MPMDEKPIWRNAKGEYDWFDEVYETANGELEQIPWARGHANKMLTHWLHANGPESIGKEALVIGCGLGDDAEVLSNSGFNVTAFDISKRAIEWCGLRHPDSKVDYEVADLFDLPQKWMSRFNLVFEASTLQALPRNLLVPAMTAIVSTKADNGLLLVAAFGRTPDSPLPEEPPWPLLKSELDYFLELGLKEEAVYQVPVSKGARPGTRYRISYR